MGWQGLDSPCAGLQVWGLQGRRWDLGSGPCLGTAFLCDHNLSWPHFLMGKTGSSDGLEMPHWTKRSPHHQILEAAPPMG